MLIKLCYKRLSFEWKSAIGTTRFFSLDGFSLDLSLSGETDFSIEVAAKNCTDHKRPRWELESVAAGFQVPLFIR